MDKSKCQLLKNVKANEALTLKEVDANDTFLYNHFFPPAKPLFTSVTESVRLSWKHKENYFVDFNQQYFIPHELSTSGPKLAVSDVNGDGLEDFYACGAKGRAGSLLIQTSNGHFTSTDTVLFITDKAYEDVDALFFDADGDGDKDLFVASGGNEAFGHSQLLSDRLYINDGKDILRNQQMLCHRFWPINHALPQPI